MTSPLNPELLPENTKYLLNFISPESLALLVENFGGSRVIFPKKMNTSNKLIKLLGKEVVEKLVTCFGNETFTVPKCSKAVIAKRNAEILKDRRNKMKQSELAIKYGLTEVSISKALRSAEKMEYEANCKKTA